MIQRIQSIFLLLMTIVMLAILFVPIWIKSNPYTEEIVVLNAFNLTYTQSITQEIIEQKSTIYICIFSILSSIISAFSIFQYKKRLTQIKLGALNSLLIGGIIFICYFFSNKGENILSTDILSEFKIGFFLPLFALFFNFLSNRFIRKDEKLVQFGNRMR